MKRLSLRVPRVIHRLVVISVLVMTLATCQRRTSPSPEYSSPIAILENAEATSTPVQLNWMGHWLYEDKRETLVRQVAQEFAFLNQDIDINLKFPQEIMGVRSKPLVGEYIADMIRTGNIEWDIVWMDDHIYQLVAEELGDPAWGVKHLVNFETVDGFQASQKLFIINDSIYRAQTGGILVGPYIEGYCYALYYNAEVAQAMGIDIKAQDMTFDDVLGYVQAVYAYNQEHDTHIAAFYEAQDWTTLEILFQNLVKSEIKDFEQAKAEVLTETKRQALFKALQAFETLGQYDPLIHSHTDNIWFDTRHLVLENQALFYVNGTWMYSHWRGIDTEAMTKMVPVELPSFNRVSYYLGGYVPTWAVLQNAPHREQAIRLVMFWSTPEVAEMWVRYTKNPTGIRGNVAIAEMGTDAFEQFQQLITDKYGANVHYAADVGYLLGQGNKYLTQAVNAELRQLLTQQTTAQEAYQRIMSQVK
jgi:ABC-type glycerol-3-phosphate transport system substrate-binding protein